MKDAFQLAPRAGIVEYQVPQRAPVKLAVLGNDARCRIARRPAQAGLPGATTARAASSASITGTPSSDEALGNGTLAARDAAGQADAQGALLMTYA